MAAGEINSSSFEFYEGLRVLLPGAMVVGLYAAISEMFGLSGGDLTGNTLSAVVIALLAGLLLLFLDLPAKAAVYLFESPLSLIVREWNVRPPPGARHLNVYYEILDSEVPTGIRNTTYYLGAMYRIGFEAIYLSAASLPVLIIAVVFPSLGPDRGMADDEQALRWIFVGAAGIHLFAIVATSRARYYENKAKGRSPGRHLLRELRTEVPIPDRILLLAGIGATVWYAAGGIRWAGLVGVFIPLAIWALRYFFGVPRPKEDPPPAEGGAKETPRILQPKRQNLHAVTAVLLFGLATVSVGVAGALRSSTPSPLSTMNLLGWLALTVVAISLIGFRNHEKRLLGSYGTQRAWLNRKQKHLIAEGYFVERTPPSPPPTAPTR